MQNASLSKIWRFDGNVGPENMDSSSFQGFECIESPKQKGLSLSERRELIHALSKQPEEASELLNSWSRNEIMKIICAEMGKKRNYTGLTKPKLIENLLNLVSRPLGETSCSDRKNSRKKQKMIGYIICCENLACRAALGSEDAFCRRCSCCICHKFDDNKDPSLWLTCESCGLSCHLECGLKQERYGIGKGDDDGGRGLDGRFYCGFCGKDNDLLGCWRKQVKVAKETRRVDVLCYRISLGQKLLRGTRKYRNLLELMDEAVTKLEGDLGPLSGWAMKMARGIVNRLPSGSQVQKLCSLAVKSLDKMAPSSSESVSGQGDKINMGIEDIKARSVTVRLDSAKLSSSLQNQITGFKLSCRMSKDVEGSSQVNSVVYLPEMKYTIQGLEPKTKFCLKVVSFNQEGDLDESELCFSTVKDDGDEAGSRQSPLTNASSGLCSNPSLLEDESNNARKSCSKENGDKENIEHCCAGEVESELQDRRLRKGKVNRIERRDLLVTPCKRDSLKDDQGGDKRSASIATVNNKKPDMSAANGVGDKDLGHIVKTIRCLEKEGHIDKSFRERFLTWYSLRATHQEVRIVKLFIETFMEDLSSLGQQLVHTFSECILSKRSSTTGVVPPGTCLKLWH